jgi:hypothetical protein
MSTRPPDTQKVDAVHALVGTEGHFPRKRIAQKLYCDYETVNCILHNDLKMRKMNFKWVPHTLNMAQQAARVEISRELFYSLEGVGGGTVQKRYIGDETCVDCDNPWT